MANQKLDDLSVEMIGINKKYIQMLRHSLKETKDTVRKINAELGKIKDPGAAIGSYGGGIGGGRRRGGKAPRASRGGRGGRAGAAMGIAAQSLSFGGRGGMGGGGGIGGTIGAGVEIWELVGGLRALGVINPATITATFAAVGTYLAYKFSPWTREATKEVEKFKASLESIPDVLSQHADIRSFESNFAGDTPDAKVADIEQQLNNAQFGYQRSLNEIDAINKEIEKAQTRTSKNAYLDPFLDKHSIESNKARLEESKKYAEEYGKQVEDLTRKLRLAKKEQDEVNKKLAQIPKDFIAGLERQALYGEVAGDMRMAGKTEGEIQRKIQLIELEQQLDDVGRSLTAEQRKRIEGMMKELTIQEKRNQKDKEQQQLVEQNAKIAQRAAEEARQAEQRRQEDVAQRAFSMLEAEKGPMQKLKDELKEIDDLVRDGGLTEAEGKRLSASKIRRMAGSFGTIEHSAGAAISADSVEGYSLRNFGQHQRTSEQDIRQMLKETENQGRTLEQIRDALLENMFGPPIEPPVASI